MEKEALLAKIKEKLGETQLSERTLGTYVERLIKRNADEDYYTDEVIAEEVETLKSLEGQYRHDLSKGIEDYKQKNPVKKEKKGGHEGDEEEDEEDVENGGDDTKALLKQLLEKQDKKFAELQKQFDDYRSEGTIKNIRAEVVKKLKEEIKTATGNDAKEYFVKIAMNSIEVDEKSDVADIVAKAKKSYDENLKEAGIETKAPEGGSGGGEEGDTTDWSAEIARKKEQGLIPS